MSTLLRLDETVDCLVPLSSSVHEHVHRLAVETQNNLVLRGARTDTHHRISEELASAEGLYRRRWLCFLQHMSYVQLLSIRTHTVQGSTV